MFVQFAICGALLSGVLRESQDFRRGIKVAGRAPLDRAGARKADDDERKAKPDTSTVE